MIFYFKKKFLFFLIISFSLSGFCGGLKQLLVSISEHSGFKALSHRMISSSTTLLRSESQPQNDSFPQNVPRDDKRTVRILSIDGGGIRAIIPLCTLKEIELKTGKPIVQLFDVVAGTSSGGLTALALNVPKDKLENNTQMTSIEKEETISSEEEDAFKHTGLGVAAYSVNDLLRLYEHHAGLVFTGKAKYSENSSLWRLLIDRNNYKPRHPIEKLEYTLKRYFKDIKLSEALSTVLLTAYEIQRGTSHLFSSHGARQQLKFDASQDFWMREVALSTAAAPTYFSPASVKNLVLNPGPDAHYHFVDGGIVSNNPTLRAFIQAKSLFPQANDFFIVSLGTGKPSTLYIDYEAVRKAGLIGWAPLITPMLMHATGESTLRQLDEIVDYEFKKTQADRDKWLKDPRYYRLDIVLDNDLIPLDKIDKKQIGKLTRMGGQLVSANRATIDRIIAEVTLPRPYATGLDKHVLVPGTDLV